MDNIIYVQKIVFCVYFSFYQLEHSVVGLPLSDTNFANTFVLAYVVALRENYIQLACIDK